MIVAAGCAALLLGAPPAGAGEAAAGFPLRLDPSPPADTGKPQLFQESRHNPTRVMRTANAAVAVDSFGLELEDILCGNHFAFHAGDFADAEHFAGTVAQPADLHDQRDGAGDLLANRAQREIE